MAHVPAYARELVELRRAGLTPDDEFVVVTNCWTLAKHVRAADCFALVVRERDEPDLRGCYGLRVIVAIKQLDLLQSVAPLVAPGRRTASPAEFLKRLDMAEGRRDELDAAAALVRPIAAAIEHARARDSFLDVYETTLRIWAISQRQVEQQQAKAKAA